MDERSCGECANLRTTLCVCPDICVASGYSQFRPARKYKRCRLCGAPMLVVAKNIVTDDLDVTYIKCSDCVLKAKVTTDYTEY